MTENETTPPLNEVELEALNRVLGESERVEGGHVSCNSDFLEGDPRTGGLTFYPDPKPRAVTSDQVARVMWEHRYHIGQAGAPWQAAIRVLADLYAAADPAFDRDKFLKKCRL